MLDIESGIRALQRSGAKITAPRIAVMKQLVGRLDHPTAEIIFNELKPTFPSLSIATVYSTLRLLASASLARILSIDNKKVCFDPKTEPHGHFLCSSCKKIVDIPIDMSDARINISDEVSSISSAAIFLYGLCSDCAKCGD